MPEEGSKEEKDWEKHERDVATFMDNLLPKGWTAERPRVSNKYSDVKIKPPSGSGLREVWIEVKMNHNDNLFNARPHYIDGKFVYSGTLTGIKKSVLKMMNASGSPARKFIEALQKHLDRDNIVIYSVSKPSSSGHDKNNAGRAAKANEETRNAYYQKGKIRNFKWSQVTPRTNDVVSWFEFKDFFKGKTTQYFGTFIADGGDVTELATIHYNQGKIKPAHYIQTGPDFYLVGPKDPLNLNLSLSPKIPRWKATGEFKIGMRLGEHPGGRTEIQPELKAKSVAESSPYGCDPREHNLTVGRFVLQLRRRSPFLPLFPQ